MMKQDPGGQLSPERVISMLLWTLMHLGTLALAIFTLMLSGLFSSFSYLPEGMADEQLSELRLIAGILLFVAASNYAALYFMRRNAAQQASVTSRHSTHAFMAVMPWIYLLVLYLMSTGIIEIK